MRNFHRFGSGTLLILLLFSLLPSSSFSQQLVSSLLTSKKLQSYQGEKKALTDIITDLEVQYQVRFNFNSQLIEDKFIDTKVANSLAGSDLEEVLRKVLNPHQLHYEKISKGHYVIYSDQPEDSKPGVKPIKRERPASLPSASSFEERIRKYSGKMNTVRTAPKDKTITGKITDMENNMPLPGVSILVKGTSQGTVTDIDGNYRLTVGDDAQTLVFSSIGYTTEEVDISGRSIIDIALAPDIRSLSEVVVVGYGTENKSDLTGSLSSISPEEFEKQPIIRVEDALKGRAAGVQVQRANGTPGAGMKIRIRGANSINGNNDPLYVIDGFIGGDISTINPNDIASINVLKDASATAIYGSRGANGVIIITTKNAAKGQSTIEFNAFYSLDEVSKKYDVLRPVEYMETVNARHDALGLGRQFTDEEINEVRTTGGTDWQDEIFRTGGIQNYQLAYSGSSEKTQYYVSGNVADQTGIVENSFYKRYGVRANLISEFSEKFDINFNLYGTLENARNNYNYNGRSNALGAAIIFSPNVPVYDPNSESGEYSQSPAYGPIASNPVFSVLEHNYDSRIFTVFSTAQLSYSITESLKFSVSGGVNNEYFNNPFFKRYNPGNSVSTSEAGHNNGYTIALQNTNILNYHKTFSDVHTIDISAIYEQQVSHSRTNGNWAVGFPTIALGYDNVSIGATARAYSGFSNWSIQSYLGRVNYNLMDKYLFTATLRVDGSSKFQGDHQYGYFPSGALAWRLSDEAFIQSLDVFQDLKLRASYGLTGSQAIGPYKTLTALATGRNYPYDGTNLSIGIGPGVPANPDLKWETTTQLDIGLDFGILNGRLSGTLDYYYKKTTDLIMDVLLPDYAGGGSVTRNVGSLENKGFEFMLSGVIVDKNKLNISSNLNLSLNRNKVLDLGAEDEIYTSGGYTGIGNALPFVLKVGEPLGVFRGYRSLGLWKSNEESEAAEYNNVPGDSKYADIDQSKTIDGEDMVIIGNAQPNFIWGWNTNVQYGSFDLNLFISGVQGNDVWNYTRWLTIGMGTDVKNPTSVEIRDRWTPQNENTDVPGFSSTNVSHVQSSRFIEDGSFIRLSNITLGYIIPERVAGRLGLAGARAYVSSQNLFTITDYSGFDPELTSTPLDSDVAQGIDNGTYPATRTYTLGLKLTF